MDIVQFHGHLEEKAKLALLSSTEQHRNTTFCPSIACSFLTNSTSHGVMFLSLYWSSPVLFSSSCIQRRADRIIDDQVISNQLDFLLLYRNVCLLCISIAYIMASVLKSCSNWQIKIKKLTEFLNSLNSGRLGLFYLFGIKFLIIAEFSRDGQQGEPAYNFFSA